MWSVNNSSSQCFFLLCFSVGASHRLQSFRINLLLSGPPPWAAGESALVPWSSFSPSFFTELGARRDIYFPLFSSLLCGIFCPSLPTFPHGAPAPAMAQPQPAEGGWIRLEPAVSGLPSRSHHCCRGWAPAPQTVTCTSCFYNTTFYFQLFHCSWTALLHPEANKGKKVNFLSGAPQSTEAMQS